MTTEQDKQFVSQVRSNLQIAKANFGDFVETWESWRFLQIVDRQARELRRLRTQMNAQNTKEK